MIFLDCGQAFGVFNFRSRIYRIFKISQDLQDFAGCGIIRGKLILGFFLTNERGGADAAASLFYFYCLLLMAGKGIIMKKLTVLTLILVLTALVQLTAPPVQAEVSIPDAELAAVIRETLELPAGAAITADAMRNLTGLDAKSRGIADLTGLEHAVNLTGLNLGAAWSDGELHRNPISNVSPLASLTNLEWLDLSGTDVSDVSALANLTNLVVLNLWSTDVSDVSALENLTKLEWLSLDYTDVSDVSALAHLTKLEWLGLSGTDVSDVSALAHLTNLEGLDLYDTVVSDVSALENLTKLVELNLVGTDVSDVSALAHLTKLVELRLGGTDVSDVSALENLTKLEGLDLGYTAVSDVSVPAHLTKLEWLDLGGTDVSDVSALAHLTKLEWLDLRYTAVSDVSALENLTKLEWLGLSTTAFSDVSVAHLTNLVSLALSGDVSDVSALAHLTNLVELNLWSTAVSDVSALENLTKLEWLELDYTDVSDVSALAHLTKLKGLELSGCPLSYASIHTHIPALQAKGIEVEFDNVAHPALLKVSGDGQEGELGAMLKTAFVVEAMDEHGEPIVGRAVEFDILGGGGRLSAKTVETDALGKAGVTLTLGSSQGVNKVRASSEGIRSWVLFTAVGTGEAPPLVADVNGDGAVTRADLVAVAEYYGEPVASGEHADGADPDADVNEDGVVNVYDILVVIVALDALDAAGAPAIGSGMSRLQAADVRQWLRDAKQANADPAGIAALEQLLASLMPKETVLLANYPNPFNPETWIPYQLSKPAEVTVTIYAANGAVVRMLDLGHRRAGSYESRSRAAYWDGRNAAGESVASGVYFYTLSAGDFSATRKMVIRK